MEDKFIVDFNMKKVALSNLKSVMFALCCICFLIQRRIIYTTLHLEKSVQFLTSYFLIILTLFSIIPGFNLTLLLVKLVLTKLIFKNKNPKLLIINNSGIFIHLVFLSNPTFINWKYIEDIHESSVEIHLYRKSMPSPKTRKYLENRNYFKNKVIGLKLKNEFYERTSFFKKILLKINNIFTDINYVKIDLILSDYNANEILEEINKYRFK